MVAIGWEVLAIIGVLAIILIWGPGQLPKLARSLGLARKELEEARKEAAGSPN